MAKKRMGHADLTKMRAFQNRVNMTNGEAKKQLLEHCILGLSEKYLKSVTDLTPVVTGHLKGNWMATPIKHDGHVVTVDIENSTDYASYVEFGHRQKVGRYVKAIGKRLTSSWAKGRYMMTKTNQIIEKGAGAYVKSKSKKFIDAYLKGEIK